MTSFNPVLTVGFQVAEPLRIHLGMTAAAAERRVIELFELVGIPNPRERIWDYPHQFSGGMRQRVMIATALACNPRLLIADEPTTALDVTIQAQIVELVKRLRRELSMAIVWITHDLALLAGLAHRMIVMYGGCIVEEAPVRALYASPLHPYALGLLGSLPRVDSCRRQRLVSIEGSPPVISKSLLGCPFSPRCAYRVPRCEKERPSLEERGSEPGHKVACWVDVTSALPEPHGAEA
jgi:oligopeptide transport system ATP-binding protein